MYVELVKSEQVWWILKKWIFSFWQYYIVTQEVPIREIGWKAIVISVLLFLQVNENLKLSQIKSKTLITFDNKTKSKKKNSNF